MKYYIKYLLNFDQKTPPKPMFILNENYVIVWAYAESVLSYHKSYDTNFKKVVKDKTARFEQIDYFEALEIMSRNEML